MKKHFVLLMTCLALAADAETLTLPVAEVVERQFSRSVMCPGYVVPVARVDVVPQVSGEIVEVAFDNGAIVKEGDVLYRIDPVQYEAAVKNAEAKLAQMKANVNYTELSYSRHRKLLGTHAVSADAVDNALSQRDTALASLAAAQADLIAAKDNLRHCTIVAPIAGKLGSTTKTKGNYVTKGSEPLVSLVQNRPIRVRFSIANRDFLSFFEGSNRRIREESRIGLLLANGESYDERGSVEYVGNEADELTDTIDVYALFKNEENKLRAGGIVSVVLSPAKGVPSVAIPPTAVLQDTQGPYVWVIDGDGKVARRTIARGDLSGDWLSVESGLKVGERIVADGAHRVKRGMTIVPAAESK